MAWSIFTNGGGDGAALTWAENLLQALGAPQTPGNEQMVYDWEVSEGGGGVYNPLNEGPVPGQPQLTSTGSQYGGGAADYVSYQAGIQGAVDYLNMSNYTQVKAGLMANNPSAAESALIASPWAASHYGGGAAFSQDTIPGQASSLISTSGSAVDASSITGTTSAANWITNLFTGSGQEQDIQNLFGTSSKPSALTSDLRNGAVRFGLIVIGGIILIIGLIRLTGSSKSVGQVAALPVTGPVGVAKKTVNKINGGG
jgi:hypothetical protein